MRKSIKRSADKMFSTMTASSAIRDIGQSTACSARQHNGTDHEHRLDSVTVSKKKQFLMENV